MYFQIYIILKSFELNPIVQIISQKSLHCTFVCLVKPKHIIEIKRTTVNFISFIGLGFIP